MPKTWNGTEWVDRSKSCRVRDANGGRPQVDTEGESQSAEDPRCSLIYFDTQTQCEASATHAICGPAGPSDYVLSCEEHIETQTRDGDVVQSLVQEG